MPIPVPIVGWIFRNAFEMGRNRNWSWRGLLSFKNACQALGKSLYYTSEDPLMKELHARVKSDLDNRKAFMAEHETALATALHNDFQSEMTKDDEADQKDEYKIHEQDVGHDKAISKYIEDNGDHDIARLSLVHYAELQTFIKVELDHELQVGRADSDKAKWLRQFSENITSHFHAITNILNIDVYRKAFIEAFFTSLLAGEGQDDDLLFHKALKESVTISNAEDVAVWLITSHELNQWIDNHWPMVVSKWPALKEQVAALSRDENADQLKSVLAHDTEARQAFVNICLKDLKNTQFFKVEKHFHIKDVKQIDIDQIDRIQLVERIERNRHLIRTQFDNFSKLQDAAQPPSFKKVVNWFITNAPVAFIRKTFPQLRQDVRESEAKAAYAKGDLSEAFSQFIGEHADQSGLNHYIPVNTRNEHAQDFIEAYNQSHSSILSLLGRLQNRAYNDKNEDIALLCSLPGYGRVFHKLAPDVLDEKASEIAQDFANFEALITHCHTTYLEHGDGKKYQKTLADLYAHGILGEAFKASVHQFTQDEKKATPEAAAIDLISQCAHQPLAQHRFHYPSFKHLHAHPQWDQLVGEVPACLSGIKTTLGYSYVNHLQALSPVRRAEMSHALKKEPKTQTFI